jgi:hypothetical protein
MTLSRRRFMAALVAGACAPAANAHTMFNQWVVYRQKHLLIGCHREDLTTYELSLQLAETLGHLLPEAAARPARAPHPERLASLLGTRQLELALLSVETAQGIRAGSGRFAPYGSVPLTTVTTVDSYVLVAHEDFTPHHGWLIAAALDQSGYDLSAPDAGGPFAPHRGVAAFRDGVPMEELLPG